MSVHRLSVQIHDVTCVAQPLREYRQGSASRAWQSTDNEASWLTLYPQFNTFIKLLNHRFNDYPQ